MRILDFFKKSIKKERLIFPQVIEDIDMIQRLDKALFDNKSPYVISFLFRLSAKDEEVQSSQEFINKGLAEKRDLSADNKEIIDNIVKAYRESKEKYIIFDSVGNLMYIAEVLDSLKEDNKLPKPVVITCFLWLYQNIVEIILSHLSELFYIIAKNRNDSDFKKEYEKVVEKEEHLTMGRLLDYAKKKTNNFTSEDKKTFLHHSELRNRLAHANCFYDSKRKEIILSTKDRLSMADFEKEFKLVKEFLFELVYLLNNEQRFEFKKDLIRLAKEYQKIGRSSIATKTLQALPYLK